MDHDVIQLYDFALFLSESTKPSLRQFSYYREVIQSLYSFWN